MKQLTTHEELIGKTIKRIASWDNLFIFFDDEFAVFQSDINGDVEIKDGVFYTEPNRHNIRTLFYLGFISEKEHDSFIEKFKKEDMEREEKNERELFERLKQKYK